jgi:quercetin dioxygenase-like cupin family protein
MKLAHLVGCLLVVLLASALLTPLAAQSTDQMSYASMASTKFMNLPMLPSCMTISAQRGDPMKGASVLLLKGKSGCVVPWHWHTVNENLMMVSGKAKAEMKSGGAHTLTAGDYLFLPGKEVHRFTCISSCVLFNQVDGAFDIHYVDADGKEIPVEQALKPAAKPAAKHAPAKKP